MKCCNWTYYCPEAETLECMVHGGFDVCCEHAACPALGRTRRGVLAQVGDGVGGALHEIYRARRDYAIDFWPLDEEETEWLDLAATGFKQLPPQYQTDYKRLARHAVAVAAYAETLDQVLSVVLDSEPPAASATVLLAQDFRTDPERLRQVITLSRSFLGMEDLR